MVHSEARRLVCDPMQKLSPEQLEWMVGILRYWGTLIPAVQALVIMIGLDIISGWIVAIAKHKLNSTTSFAGMCKKAMILLLTAVGIILEPFANGLPLSTLIAMGFIAMEGLSIVENAAALGIWVPAPLLEVLEKMQRRRAGTLEQKSGGQIAALNLKSAALDARVEQHNHPLPVVDVVPVQAQVVNPPTHPVPVTSNP